jgi:hypothetical protein
LRVYGLFTEALEHSKNTLNTPLKGEAKLILFPVMVDGREYPNLREAHRAVFLKEKIGYDRFQRSLKRGKAEFCGHSIKKIERKYDIGLPETPDSDGVDLLPIPAKTAPIKEHKRGEPLLRYEIFDTPLMRGIRHWR